MAAAALLLHKHASGLIEQQGEGEAARRVTALNVLEECGCKVRGCHV